MRILIQIIKTLMQTKYFKLLAAEVALMLEAKIKQMLIEKIENKIRQMESENELQGRNLSNQKSNQEPPCLRLVST